MAGPALLGLPRAPADATPAAERLVHALGRTRVERLVAASRTEPAKVRERLRWLLERAGRDDAPPWWRVPAAARREAALAVVPA